MTTGFLERITDARRTDAVARAADGARDAAQRALATAAPPLDLRGVLAADGIGLIAEVKRASPSAGPIRPDVDPVAQAASYAAGGAAAISVLTEPDHFLGSLDDLRAVRRAVDVPILRKDFIAHPLMVEEARAAGADAVLLIVAALMDQELRELHALARSLGMTALVEVHDPSEVERALAVQPDVIGINTRNLMTLEVEPATIAAVRPLIPEGVVVVGESGIGSRADVALMEDAGVDAVLVGETLMRTADPATGIAALLGRA